MKTAGVIGLMYSALVLAGGLIAYITTGSIASAVTGGGFGLAILVSALAMLKGKVGGWYAALGLAAVLALFFGNRFRQSGVFMPAGLMAALSLVAMILFLVLRRGTA